MCFFFFFILSLACAFEGDGGGESHVQRATGSETGAEKKGKP